MEAPILQVTVLKGPKNGENLVCKPESTIQIGRVITGNNWGLRDPGISQKHLRFRFCQEASRWFVSDLDTSNGTILNGSPIQASVLVPVSDGDVIQIGVKTELGIKIVAPGVLKEKEEGGDVKGGRITRRGGSSRVNTRACSSRVLEEEAGVNEAQSRVSAPVRGRRNNARAILDRVSNEEDKKEENLNPDLVSDSRVEVGQKGRGRGRRNIVSRNSGRVLEEEKEETRDSVMISCSETEEPDLNREVKLRRNPRRRNSSRVLKELDANCTVDSVLEVKEVGMKRKGRGRGKGKVSTVSEESENGNENLVLEIESENCDSDSVAISELRKEIKGRTRGNSSMVIEEKEGEEDDGVKEILKERNSEELGGDFENMTLDQWFRRMEWFMPKVIYDESEDIVGILKEKARNFDALLEAGNDVA